jgi:hypothetical protein
MSVVDVTLGNLRKSNQGVNGVIPNVAQQGRLAILRIYVTKESKVSRIEACYLRLSHQLFKGQENRDGTQTTAL